MLNRLLFAAMAVFGLGTAQPAAAGPQQDEVGEQAEALLQQRGEDIAEVLKGEMPSEEVFSERFLQAVPEERLVGLITQLETQFGPFQGLQSVEPTGAVSANITVRFEGALAMGEFALNPKAPFLVEGLNLRDFQPISDSPDKIVADLATLPGETGMLLVRLDDGEVLVSHQPDQLFAIGSTFKLYILGAIGRQVREGELSWSDIVPLTERSFPSGMLQDWPQGAPLTVQTLASLMISISDNTATDQLLMLAGRDAVEAEVAASGHADAAATLPFITTREMFVLKASPASMGEAYLAADIPTRRTMLAALDLESVDMEQVATTFAGAPRLIELEWLASPADLAALMAHLRDMDDPTIMQVMAINPGITGESAEGFAYIGYKGGSEPGVLNQTWLLQTKDGAWYALSTSWNNPDESLDNNELIILARRAMGLLLPEAEAPAEAPADQ
ncbi:serine hydrolase [Paraurantiacibacter namhicola]|uniref:Beta-lactamase TEM n=1 Tax=Paraurantiacibacter namhicola TaxID=645517 RepID=A0A1C7D9M3_9SPHN|nr:serine hydrolase [Paraurantiacibacter namhicola]ANU08011.1 Beta-lactamase TEM precursor [Paraurantiacibacter namhicola]